MLRNRSRLNGSFSVEAALIMPIVVFMVITLMYLAFCVHDTVAIQSLVDGSLVNATLLVRQPCEFETTEIYYDEIKYKSIFDFLGEDFTKEEAIIKTYLEENLAKQLMMSKVQVTKVAMKKESVSITVVYQGNYLIGIPFIKPQEKMISMNCEVNNPTEFVRKYENGIEVVSNIKGYDQVKCRITEIFELFR